MLSVNRTIFNKPTLPKIYKHSLIVELYQNYANESIPHIKSITRINPSKNIFTFGKPHKTYLTYNLIHKVWNKTKYLQEVKGFTEFSPIWLNEMYLELAKL